MSENNDFTHFDENGKAIMVDVTKKEPTMRKAVAKGSILVSSTILEKITGSTVEKGDVLGVARVAGIMAVKKTPDLIPMCHPLQISKCTIDFDLDKENNIITCFCEVKMEGKTGVEMEAMTGVSVALLTIYDMCKAMDRGMEISGIHLVEKSGGKSGHYKAEK